MWRRQVPSQDVHAAETEVIGNVVGRLCKTWVQGYVKVLKESGFRCEVVEDTKCEIA